MLYTKIKTTINNFNYIKMIVISLIYGYIIVNLCKPLITSYKNNY